MTPQVKARIRTEAMRRTGYWRNRTTITTPRQGRIQWRELALVATRYNDSQLGAILCAAFLVSPLTAPRFSTRAMVTSDGFIMCTFTNRQGQVHPSAFVSSVSELMRNVNGLCKHLNLKGPETEAMILAIGGWLGADPITAQPMLRNQETIDL